MSKDYTDEAQVCIDAYLDAVDEVLRRSGVSRAERRDICDDLEGQIFETFSTWGSGTVNRDDAQRVLDGLDSPESYARARENVSAGSESTVPPQDPSLQVVIRRLLSRVAPHVLVGLVGEDDHALAAVLAELGFQMAATHIEVLAPERQTQVAAAILGLDNDGFLRGLAPVLTEVLRPHERVEGKQSLAAILTEMGSEARDHILSALVEAEPDAMHEVRSMMFIFDDLHLLTDASVQRLLREVTQGDLALALKNAREVVRDKVFKNVSRDTREHIKGYMSEMGPVRLSQVDDMQREIVEIVRRLEMHGEIVIMAHPERQDGFTH